MDEKQKLGSEEVSAIVSAIAQAAQSGMEEREVIKLLKSGKLPGMSKDAARMSKGIDFKKIDPNLFSKLNAQTINDLSDGNPAPLVHAVFSLVSGIGTALPTSPSPVKSSLQAALQKIKEAASKPAEADEPEASKAPAPSPALAPGR